MEVDFEVEQYSSISHGDSSGTAVMVPQSPLSVIEQDIQGGEIKIVLPFEEELASRSAEYVEYCKGHGIKD